MNLNKKLAVAVSGAVLLMAGQFALADSTTDIVDALVSKGVLTEEEGKLISKGAKSKSEADAKANKSRVSVGSFIDNATMYGDIRVRGEYRNGYAASTETDLTRGRYKMTLGVKTESGAWYSDIAAVMGGKGRSDNADFGTQAKGEVDYKEALFLKRAMFGWKPTEWLTLQAGRMANPLYTTAMVWDADLNVEGLSEQAKFTSGNTEYSLLAVQSIIKGKRSVINGVTQADTGTAGYAGTSEYYAVQAGVKFPITEKSSGKAVIGYATYGKNNVGSATTTASAGNAGPGAAFASTGDAYYVATNNLSLWEAPFEVNYMVTDSIGIKPYGHYVYNSDADQRARASGVSGSADGAGNEDTAWLLGIVVASAKDLKSLEGNKMKKGDWSGRLWYQSVGAWSIDPSLTDSDFMDGRTNMEGTVFKGKYALEDNVTLDFAAGHANKKNRTFRAFGQSDIAGDLNDYNLYQIDVTYKF